MSYILPDKNLLEDKSKEIENLDKYYNLSKLIYKKDIKDKLVVPVGVDDENKYYMDFKTIPSIFVTGETGSGKSMFLNDIIISLLLKNNPDELKFLFIDPKKIEFLEYANLPHTINHISDKNESLINLKVIFEEMQRRRYAFVECGVNDINEYNETAKNYLPQIIVIIDEALDLIEYEGFEGLMLNLINESYKYGIHTVMSTSTYYKGRLSDKFASNFKYILSFDLAVKEQAKFIKLKGADLLTVNGEALVRCPKEGIIDIQVPYVSDKDIKNVIKFINMQ